MQKALEGMESHSFKIYAFNPLSCGKPIHGEGISQFLGTGKLRLNYFSKIIIKNSQLVLCHSDGSKSTKLPIPFSISSF